MENLLPVQTPQSLILKRLILLEITLLIVGIGLEYTRLGSLPPLLQQYQHNEAQAPFSLTDGLLIGFGIPSLILWIVAWVALWKNWSSGRGLYTFACAVLIPLNLLIGPTVYSAFSATLNIVTSMVTGAILGILYFSDLRHRYERQEE